MFRLSDLLAHNDLVIQCHNYPDADAIASAFAVYAYLKANGKNARLIYSGGAEITKPNLTEMVGRLSIPIEYVTELPRVDTLIMTDCQYGESNAARFEADTVFIIDHHEEKTQPRNGIIRSQLGSCSTLVWDLLRGEGFDFESHPNVCTALYYGLYTDTNSFEEIAHPLDRDMRDSIKYDREIITTLRFNNLTLGELSIAGAALTRHKVDPKRGYAVFRADACDQNILGFISDLALQVEGVGLCIVYNTLPDGYKLSIRSCNREVMANEYAAFLSGGGGHIQKAGGFISKAKLGDTDVDDFIEARTREYFDGYEVVYAANHSLDISVMSRYRKRKIPVGYVKSTDIFAEGTPMLIRTLEGDTEADASDGVYLMIGVLGEVYPINAEKFKRSYTISEEAFETDFSYSPTARNKLTGDTSALLPCAKPCVALGEVFIYARPVTKNTKVFTAWNAEGYMYGKSGDYIAVRSDDYNDVYIIRADIFAKTYEIS